MDARRCGLVLGGTGEVGTPDTATASGECLEPQTRGCADVVVHWLRQRDPRFEGETLGGECEKMGVVSLKATVSGESRSVPACDVLIVLSSAATIGSNARVIPDAIWVRALNSPRPGAKIGSSDVHRRRG